MNTRVLRALVAGGFLTAGILLVSNTVLGASEVVYSEDSMGFQPTSAIHEPGEDIKVYGVIRRVTLGLGAIQIDRPVWITCRKGIDSWIEV